MRPDLGDQSAPAGFPNCTLQNYEQDFQGRHLLHDVVRYWAGRNPDGIAIINADRSTRLNWRGFDQLTTGLAMQLLKLGLRKGDYLAASLPLSTEHVLLEYACFKIGVIHAPLDLRLPANEVIRSLSILRAKAFAFLGVTPLGDFRELGRAIQKHCSFVRHLLQFSAPGEVIEGSVSFSDLLQRARTLAQESTDERSSLEQALVEAMRSVTENDGALVIFTTGSTGSPKPALLSHRNITCQNMCLSAGFRFVEDTRSLVNLPPSHVGCQTELLMTTLFRGGTAVILEVFDPAASLSAIQEHKVTLLGQIPAMFQFEWRLAGYEKYDLSSLQVAVYGGQQVSPAFTQKMAQMAPGVATGLGLTEAAGFCTYTPAGMSAKEIAETLGYSMPVYPMSVREPMRDDGSAGSELPDGELGHICFQGPQTFLGYVNDPAATAKAISSDGYLYTGDLGFRDAKGLHLAGRARWLIKSAGYMVFPSDVENHICAFSEKVAACGVVGAEHGLVSEAIIAFVERKPGAELTIPELRRHARALATYMRPRHYVVLDPGKLPLNRAVKIDYVRLAELARQEVQTLRSLGRWDARHLPTRF